MRGLLAIAWNTIRASLRSRVVHVLLACLGLTILVLPVTIMTDGTARGMVQVSLTYTLGLVTFLLAMVTVWLGCTLLADEIETYQVHMVTSKPVSRLQFIAGKWLGLIVLQGSLLLIAAAFILGLMVWRLGRANFPTEELMRLQHEVLVGRRVYRPYLPPNFLDQLVEQEVARRREAMGGEPPPETPGLSERAMEKVLRDTLRGDIKKKLQELPPGMARRWVFINLPRPDPNTPLFLRYRFYVDASTNREQRDSDGVWLFRNWRDDSAAGMPYSHRGGLFHELVISPELVSPDGVLELVYENRDGEGKSIVWQENDGPTIMVRTTGFAGNYARAVGLIFLELVFLATLACVCGALLSTPVAIFLSYAYVFLGGLLVSLRPTSPETAMIPDNVVLLVLYHIRQLVDMAVLALGDFSQVTNLAKGQLIEWGTILTLFVGAIIVRALPIALVGAWLFRRRELGLVTRR